MNHSSHAMVQPWLYHGTMVSGDRSPEVDDNPSKSGSRINNHLFAHMPYCYYYTQWSIKTGHFILDYNFGQS